MKKICLLLILSIVLTGCVYESFRSLYGDEWMADHLPNQESADQSSDTGHIGATPIINISDNTNDSNDVTGDSSNDTIIPSVTTTTIRYTITFNANGGSGTMEDITMINGEERALPLCSFTAPLGKKFSCWLASDNNYASYYSDREVVKDLMSENGAIITLSAQWLEQSQYSIFYYNTMNAANSNPTTFFESESVTLQNLSVTGYDFVGWNDAITGKRITGWAAGERTSNITLGAEWTPHKYTVIYYGNGGIGQTKRQTVSYGESFVLRENGFTRDGYTFIGWCTNSNGGGTGYSAGQTVSNLTTEDGGIVELYALWDEDKTDKWQINNAGNITQNGEEFPFTSFEQVMSEPVTIVGSDENWSSYTSVKDNMKGVFINGRTIRISPFNIGKYNVTQKLYESVMNTGEIYDDELSKKLPICTICWYDAIVFCNKLSLLLGRQPCYSVDGIDDWQSLSYTDISIDGSWNVSVNMSSNGYRLPTEAEWEFAARGGDPTKEDWKFAYSGIDIKESCLLYYSSSSYKGNCTVGQFYGYSGKNSWMYSSAGFLCWDDSSLPKVGISFYVNTIKIISQSMIELFGVVPDLAYVGSKLPNRLGIYDMSGNVGELCWDEYNDINTGGIEVDPIGTCSNSQSRVIRGGDIVPMAYNCCVSYRGHVSAISRCNRIGFRLVYSVR